MKGLFGTIAQSNKELVMLRNIEISVEIIKHNGMLVLTALHEGEFYKMRYVDFPVHQAKANFINYINEQRNKKVTS
jgi:hypothetical protein